MAISVTIPHTSGHLLIQFVSLENIGRRSHIIQIQALKISTCKEEEVYTSVNEASLLSCCQPVLQSVRRWTGEANEQLQMIDLYSRCILSVN